MPGLVTVVSEAIIVVPGSVIVVPETVVSTLVVVTVFVDTMAPSLSMHSSSSSEYVDSEEVSFSDTLSEAETDLETLELELERRLNKELDA